MAPDVMLMQGIIMPGGRMPGVLARILVGRGMRSFADGFVALLR